MPYDFIRKGEKMEKINDLKLLRGKLGLTQIQMSELIGMTYVNYINYERENYKSMSEEVEKKISDKTGYEFRYRPNDLIVKEEIPDSEKTLKQLREERGLRQVDIIKLLDMTYSNYVNYERGIYKSMPEELEKKISDILEIDYHYRRG